MDLRPCNVTVPHESLIHTHLCPWSHTEIPGETHLSSCHTGEEQGPGADQIWGPTSLNSYVTPKDTSPLSYTRTSSYN